MTVDSLALIRAARVPDYLVPWGRNELFNAHRVEGTTFLFDASSVAGMMMLDFPDEGYGGYTVMDDSAREVSRHLEAVRHARGRILKTGLGLGCFVRMCLTKPEVEHIDVIEIDRGIAEHFGGEFQDDPRVEIHIGDALTLPISDGSRWDLAWHDIYCDGNDGLQVQHVKLIKRFWPHARRQGAWGLPRWAKRLHRTII